MGANMGVAMELNVTASLEMDTVASTETGVDVDAGMDSKSVVDMSGNISTGASAEVETGVGMSVTVAGTGANMVVDVEMVLLACVAVGAQHITAEVVEVKIYAGTGMVPSACAVAGVQHRTVMVETDVVVVADVHTGMGPEIILVLGVEWGMEAQVKAAMVGCVGTGTVAVGASTKTATLAGSVVGQMEGKKGPCAAFDDNVAGQDINTMQGMLSNSQLCLHTGTHLESETQLWVAGGMWASCSWGKT